jgi:peptidoglycan glycosyltransferase
MEKRIRMLGLIFILLFALLFIQLNNWQIRQATTYTAPTIPKSVVQANQFTQERGMILTSDFQIIARSVLTGKNWVRDYPQGKLFADITG